MNKRLSVLVLLALVVVFNFGCSKKPAAVVNGEEISMEDFQRQLNQRLESHKIQGASVQEKRLKEAVLQELIGRKLLLQVAREKNITVTDDEINKEIDSIKQLMGEKNFSDSLKKWNLSLDKYRSQLKETLMIRKLLAKLVPDDSIKEEDMKKYFKNRPTPYMQPEQVMVKLVQTGTEEEARALLDEMKKDGIDFDKFTEKLKREKRAVVSNYGWVQPGFFSGEIKDALKELKPGQVGGPYKGRDGYYILKVKERQPEKVLSYEEARDQIKKELILQKRQATMAHMIEERKKKAKIEININ